MNTGREDDCCIARVSYGQLTVRTISVLYDPAEMTFSQTSLFRPQHHVMARILTPWITAKPLKSLKKQNKTLLPKLIYFTCKTQPLLKLF